MKDRDGGAGLSAQLEVLQRYIQKYMYSYSYDTYIQIHIHVCRCPFYGDPHPAPSNLKRTRLHIFWAL